MNQLYQRIQQNLQCLPPKDVHKDKWLNVDRGQLEQLTLDVREYTSYLDLSDISNDLEEEF